MDECTFQSHFDNIEITNHYIKSNSNAQIALRKLLEFSEDTLYGIDTETMAKPEYRHIKDAALNPHLSDIRLLQISADDNVSYIIDCLYVDPRIFLPLLRSRRFVGHYAKFDYKHFNLIGAGDINIGCSQIIAKSIVHCVTHTDGLQSNVGLDDMVKSLFNIDLPKYLQASDWGIPELSFEQLTYAGLDPIAALEITKKLIKGITKYGLERTYTLLKAAQKPICELELNGIRLNVEGHQKLVIQWRDELFKAKKELTEITGITRLTGPELGKWLHANLPEEILDIWPRTEGATEDNDKLSTDSNTFVLFDQLPIVKPFSEFQKRATLTSTFGMKLINQVCPATGNLHANYNIAGARTGRLSSSKPNLQNLPRDKRVRANFIPRIPGNVFVCADFSQIELRVAAELSRDNTMLHAFNHSIDLHKLTASQVSGLAIEQIGDDSPERKLAKAINFGLLFGLGAKKFSHYAKKSYKVDISQADAKKAIQVFRDTYDGYRAWQLGAAEQGQFTGYSRTPCGKLRKLDPKNYYGMSMNTPIQGGAAEVMLHSLIRLYNYIKHEGLNWLLTNCVHDEILIECPQDEKRYCAEVVNACMVEGFLDVFPNGITKDIVGLKVGDTWGTTKKYDVAQNLAHGLTTNYQLHA